MWWIWLYVVLAALGIVGLGVIAVLWAITHNKESGEDY